MCNYLVYVYNIVQVKADFSKNMPNRCMVMILNVKKAR